MMPIVSLSPMWRWRKIVCFTERTAPSSPRAHDLEMLAAAQRQQKPICHELDGSSDQGCCEALAYSFVLQLDSFR